MQEKSQQGLPSDNKEQSEGRRTTIKPLFAPPENEPSMATQEPSAPVSRPLAGVGTFVRVILPTALLIAALAGFAWIAQYLPHWRTENTTTRAEYTKPLIRFPVEIAEFGAVEVYDVKDKKNVTVHVLEMEAGRKGYYDFVCYNDSSTDAELGLEKKGCGCTTVQACALPRLAADAHVKAQARKANWIRVPTEDSSYGWQELKAESGKGIVIPSGQAGLVRLTWQARGEPGTTPNLSLEMWSQPKGKPFYRAGHALNAKVFIEPPILCAPPDLDVGVIRPGRSVERRFFCWSATRDDFKVSFPSNKENPCIHCEAEKLSKEECLANEQKLHKAGSATKVRAAYRVTVTISEEKDGKQLDVGPIYQHVPALFTVDGDVVAAKTPMLKGRVASDIRVVGGAGNAINLGNFSSSEQLTRTIYIYSPKDTKLKILEQEPAYLRVDFKDKGVEKKQHKWEVTLTIPPNRHVGRMPEGSRLLLQSTKPNGNKRRVRIPITGTAITS